MNSVLLEQTRLAIENSQLLRADFPSWGAVDVALQQLEIVRRAMSGQQDALIALSKVNLGLLAAREFEDTDQSYAALLYEIQGLVDQITKAGGAGLD